MTKEQYLQRLSEPLEVKVMMAKVRLREFITYYGMDKVYLSDSMGKDSAVVRHLLWGLYGEDCPIPSVHLDTWMEYPQARTYRKKVYANHKSLEIIKPKMTMKEIIETCGWCFPSKDVAEMIDGVRRDQPWAIRKINGLDKDGNPTPYREQYKKWWPLVDIDIKISQNCCIEMKEKPAAEYEKQTGRHPILALLGEESARRREAYMRTGCNSFDTIYVLNEETGEYEEKPNARPMSKPLGPWTEQDVLTYIVQNKVKIQAAYGEIYEQGQVVGQTSMFDTPCSNCKYKCSGESRTGCMFCPVGGHLDNFAKIERVKSFNPDLYDYCMEELGEKDLIDKVRTLGYCK